MCFESLYLIIITTFRLVMRGKEMKVVDIQVYRLKRDRKKIESQVSSLVLSDSLNTASKIKTFFKEWLKLQK